MRMLTSVALCLLLVATASFAQSDRGTIAGTVTDPDGSVIPGVPVVAENPEEAALEYARESLLPRSASSLRYAVRALRLPLSRRIEGDLARLESLYLEELMQTEDAAEGIQAFLEKRPPEWRDR